MDAVWGTVWPAVPFCDVHPPCRQPYRATRATIREALASGMPGACQQGPPRPSPPPSPLRIRALRRRLPPKKPTRESTWRGRSFQRKRVRKMRSRMG